MPIITLTMTHARGSARKNFGTNNCAPGNNSQLAQILTRELAKFEEYTGGKAKDISLKVEDFTDHHTTTGYR